jgi:hypothetical protein
MKFCKNNHYSVNPRLAFHDSLRVFHYHAVIIEKNVSITAKSMDIQK